jgi:calcineurin-like phosphoesterase family protein
MPGTHMTNIWVVSDTHFGHANIIKYCNRPFANTLEMDETMIANWNSVVKENDHVYHLGDVGMGSDNLGNTLRRLNGKKRLIVGNHDDLKSPVLMRHFEKIMMWRVWKEHKIVFSHIPLHEGSLKFGGYEAINVHGHIHDKELPDKRYKCLCVEHTNYTPVNIDDLKDFTSKLKGTK